MFTLYTYAQHMYWFVSTIKQSLLILWLYYFPVSKLTGQLLTHGQRLFLFPACTFSFFTKFYSLFFEILQCIPPTGANQTGARFFLLENVQNYTTLLSVIMQACIFLYHFEKYTRKKKRLMNISKRKRNMNLSHRLWL